jgi:DNA repair photolyase
MAMPILPWLSDSDEALDSLFAELARAGATGVTAGALYLRPGTREWFMQWLAATHPQLLGRYRELYSTGSYASKEYQHWLAAKVNSFKNTYGFAGSKSFIRDARGEEPGYPEGSITSPGAKEADSDVGEPTLF